VLEQDIDKLTYNVDADPESKTSSTFDILRKVPLLTIDADENLQLNGNGNYQLLINGKPSTLFAGNQSDIFKSFPASAIKTIEVITIPSLHYETKGIGGIINIITYKKNLSGYNGGLNLKGSKPLGYSTNGNLTASPGKLGLSVNYGYSSNNSPVNRTNFYRQDKILKTRLEQVGSSHNKNWSQNLSCQLTYEINRLNLLTANYSNNRSNTSNDFTQQVGISNTTGVSARAYNSSAGMGNMHGKEFSLDYQLNFKKNDAQQLMLSWKWNNNKSITNTDFIQESLANYNQQARITKNGDESGEHTLQADYIQPIKKHIMELGANSTTRQNSSDYFYKNLDTLSGDFVLDTSQSNKFNYKEVLYAAYISINLKVGKWDIKIGSRLEGSNIDAHFVSTGTIAKQNYLNLIPGITISRQLEGFSLLKFSYTQRYNRPDLYFLDPYVDRTDPFNISYGNPNLEPAKAHVFNISYNAFIKHSPIFISAFHEFTNNSIQQFTFLAEDTIAHTSFGNIGKNQNTNLSLSANMTLYKNLSISLNSSSNYVRYINIIKGNPYSKEGFTNNLSVSAYLRLKTWRFGSNVNYSSPGIQIQVRSTSYFSNSIALSKNFNKNKINIGLNVHSPFKEYRRSFTIIDDPAFYQQRETRYVIRRYSFSLSYRFDKIVK
jgi:outer membrane cobalamin receptor